MGRRWVEALAGTLLLLSLQVQAQENQLDRIQLLRSESYRAVSIVLLSYNAFSRTLAPDRRDEYLGSLEKMAAVMGDPGLATLEDEFAEFAGAIRSLDENARDVALVSVNQALSAQAKLITAAGELYASRQTADSARKQRLHALSVANGQMLISYQMRPYGGLVLYPGLLLNEESLLALDGQITAGLELLRQDGMQPERDIDSMQRNYRYVRPKFFDAQKEFAAYVVDHYLGQNMERLDAFAGRL
ncbi:hypothetical protein D3880_02350 [Pseudomonas cavernae]|uniref:Uncharacterized protein n=1 Tax=Pseudomonas cavernae TaxID=2320867 RepID=A0A385Z102_9PSED|nr:hypothetical protein [Pseudomonas cavernae]AYC31302.1 hypothetical protein D3880_02350 [Pseudomonas cavernae]